MKSHVVTCLTIAHSFSPSLKLSRDVVYLKSGVSHFCANQEKQNRKEMLQESWTVTIFVKICRLFIISMHKASCYFSSFL